MSLMNSLNGQSMMDGFVPVGLCERENIFFEWVLVFGCSNEGFLLIDDLG